jgi:hypothetical protein
MDNPALARIHCDGLRDLVADNPSHWKEEQALERIRALSARAREAIEDRASRAYLSAIDDCASALCWKADGGGPVPDLPPYALRREIMRQLRLLSERLSELAVQRAQRIAAPAPSRLPKRERYASTLREAAGSVGGSERLAALLRVPPPDLLRWTDGGETAPLKVFLAALNIVAGPGESRDVPTAKPAWRRSGNLRYVSAAAGALFAVCVTLYLSSAPRRDVPVTRAAAAQIVPVATAQTAPAPIVTKPRKPPVKSTVARKVSISKPPAVPLEPSRTVAALQESEVASVIPASPQY